MEDNRNKNTLLLTVIAVATLLVAIVGATFAYFTAQITGGESGSTIEVNSATLTITYSGGTPNVVSEQPIEPMKGVTTGEGASQTTTYTPAISKTFTLVGTNDTGTGNAASPAMVMPYELYLVVTKNTFVLQNTITETSISYKFTGSSTVDNDRGLIPNNNGFKGIPAITLTGVNYSKPTDGDELQQNALGTITTYNDDGTVALNNVSGLKLGFGYFANSETSITHSYTLEIYFVDDENNQDFDKAKEFEGYITVSAGNAATKISSTSTAVNCANDPTNEVCTAE